MSSAGLARQTQMWTSHSILMAPSFAMSPKARRRSFSNFACFSHMPPTGFACISLTAQSLFDAHASLRLLNADLKRAAAVLGRTAGFLNARPSSNSHSSLDRAVILFSGQNRPAKMAADSWVQKFACVSVVFVLVHVGHALTTCHFIRPIPAMCNFDTPT